MAVSVRRALLATVSGLCVNLLLTATAFAQQAAAATDGGLEEVVVTGDRNNQYGTDVVQTGSFRGAKVIDVPLTVSVIPSAVLKSQQAVDLIDALRNTAGVSSNGISPVAYNNVTVRGISVDTRSNFKLDGALNILSSTAFPLEDKDRVEVLKGASGLYYGFSTPAGIVNMTMKRPTPDFYLSEDTFFDSNSGVGEHVDVGDTVGDFGYRLNGLYAYLDTGINLSAGHRYLVSGAFDYRPTDNLTITLDLERFGRKVVEPGIFRFKIPAGTAPVQLPSLALVDPSVNFAGASWAVNDTTETNGLLKAVWKISSDWNLSGYYGLSELTRIRDNPRFTPTNMTTALTSGAGSIVFSPQDTYFRNQNYAMELAGKVDLGFLSNEVLLGASRAQRSLASPAPQAITISQNFLNPTVIPLPNNVVSVPRPPASHVDDIGYYFFDRVIVNQYIQLLGGVRKNDYTDDGSINAVTKSPYHVSPWTFSGGAVVKPVDWISLYGTYIEGLEATAGGNVNDENALETFPPTRSVQYEAGIKLEPMDNLLIQAAYFDIKQGSTFEAINPATGNPHFYNIGRNHFRGLEFSLTGYVTPDLALYATATTLSAHYQDTPGIGGLRIEGTPELTWSLAGEYTLSWLNPAFKLTAGAYHTGSQAVNAGNNAFTPAYTTFDLGGSYTFDFDEHEAVLRVNAQNITNERYWAATGGSVLAESVPGLVKISLSVKY